MLQRLRCVRRDLCVETNRSETDSRARMVQDIAKLAAVKLGVRPHRGKSGVPDAEHQLDIVQAIPRGNGDVCAGLMSKFWPRHRREPRRAARRFIVIPKNLVAVSESWP